MGIFDSKETKKFNALVEELAAKTTEEREAFFSSYKEADKKALVDAVLAKLKAAEPAIDVPEEGTPEATVASTKKDNKKAPKEAKCNYKIVGPDVIKLNKNLIFSMDGRKGTIKLSDAIAENLLARDKTKYSAYLTKK